MGPGEAAVHTESVPSKKLYSSDFEADVNENHAHLSTLYPGARYRGYQTSGDKKYEVEVRVKEVDFAQSYVCGDLLIRGLTDEYPELVTCFEGEMIGDRYSFETGKWKASRNIDMQHWRRFRAFDGLECKAMKNEYVHDRTHADHIFMRWKEQFVVPDPRVSQLKGGASFAGFYYICFRRTTGRIEGLYYHAMSEMYQRLELHLVPERKFGTYEFR